MKRRYFSIRIRGGTRWPYLSRNSSVNSFIQSKRWIYRFNVISMFIGIWQEEERPCIYSGYSFVTICNSNRQNCSWLWNTSLTSAVLSQGMAWPLGVLWSVTDILQLKIHWAKAGVNKFSQNSGATSKFYVSVQNWGVRANWRSGFFAPLA